MIKCPCGLAYIGKTTQAVRDRISQHKSNIRCNRDHLPLPHHFRTMGHNIAQLKFKVVEQIEQGRRGQNRVKLLKKPVEQIEHGRRGQNRVKLLKKRESYWIFTLQTLEPKGLNRDYDNMKPLIVLFVSHWAPYVCLH
ncbi:unnamed protein product, partial [Ranitomeya imitator]